jgi:hypothetical protein
VSHTSCGLNNGGGTVVPTGGTGYTYLWSNGATTQSVSGLASGTYTVTVTDIATSCTASASVTINASTAVTASTGGVIHTSCNLNNGTATANGTGGNGIYTYAWSNGGTTATISSLGAGSYTVTVTDGGGCTGTSSVTINSSTAVSATILTTIPTSCGQNNGTVTATATGGTPNYTYAWSNGGTSATINGLAPGTYTVTVTDQGGCTATTVATISSSTAPTLSVTSQTDVLCFGDSTGSATATGASGTAPYTYAWSNGATGGTVSGLTAGPYQVTVTDASGCTAVTGGNITQPASALSSGFTVTDESNPGALDGSIALSPAGGTSAYTYAWSNGQTTQTATGLAGGTYTCTITDANGCTFIVTATVNTLVGISGITQLGLEVYPNPNHGTFSVAYELGMPEDLKVTVYNKLGQRVWEQTIPQADAGKVEVALGEKAAGVYSVELQAGDAVVTRKVVVGK